MEFIFELLFELIFEGSLELGMNKKVAMPVRILAMAFVLLIVGAFLAVLFMMALSVMKKKIVFGWLIILFDLFMLGCFLYAIWKRVKK